MAAPEKYDGIDFKPPKAVAEAAEKGLEYRAKANPSDKGGLTPAEAGEQGIGSGVQRATNLKNRNEVSPDVIRQMCAFFARHEKNKAIKPENRDTPWKQKGYVAWLLWGGDPGKTWAEKVRDQMDRADEKADKTAMTHRVASRFAAIAKAVDIKKAVEKLSLATEKAFQGQPGVGTTLVRLNSTNGFEVGEVYVNGGQYQIRLVGIVQEDVISIGVHSGNTLLTSLGSRGPSKDAAKRLKKPVGYILKTLAEKVEKAAPKSPSLDGVQDRLLSIRLGPAGRAISVTPRGSKTEWEIDPQRRQRLDHYGNDGDGWDDEAWDEDYRNPVRKAGQKWLDDEFGSGLFGIEVGEKGHVDIYLTAAGKKKYGV